MAIAPEFSTRLRRDLLTWLTVLVLSAVLGLSGCRGPTDPGERVWVRKCAACHGKDGRGRTRFSQNRPFADLTDGKWKQGGDRASIYRSIEAGVPKTPMEGFGKKLTPEQIDAVTGYVLRLEAAARTASAQRK